MVKFGEKNWRRRSRKKNNTHDIRRWDLIEMEWNWRDCSNAFQSSRAGESAAQQIQHTSRHPQWCRPAQPSRSASQTSRHQTQPRHRTTRPRHRGNTYKIQTILNRTILRFDALPIAHFETDVLLFSKHLWKLAISLKLWVPAHSEVGWSRTVSKKNSHFRVLFWINHFFQPNWTKKHPQVLYMVGKLRICS